MLIEIQGDVWLLSEVVGICIADDSITIHFKDGDNAEYVLSSNDAAQRKHIELVDRWNRYLRDVKP